MVFNKIQNVTCNIFAFLSSSIYKTKKSFLQKSELQRSPNDMSDGPNSGFDYISIRKEFIKKVFGVLTLQMLITVGIIKLCLHYEPVKSLVMKIPFLLWISLGVVIATLIVLYLCQFLRRSSSTNLIFLGIFTLGLSILLGSVSQKLDPDLPLMVIGIIAAVSFALSFFAFQTKWDLSVSLRSFYGRNCKCLSIFGGFWKFRVRCCHNAAGFYHFCWGSTE